MPFSGCTSMLFPQQVATFCTRFLWTISRLPRWNHWSPVSDAWEVERHLGPDVTHQNWSAWKLFGFQSMGLHKKIEITNKLNVYCILLYFGIFWGWFCTFVFWTEIQLGLILLLTQQIGFYSLYFHMDFSHQSLFFWGGSPCFSKQKWLLQHVSTPPLLGIFQEASHRQGLLIPQLRSATHQGCHPGVPPRLTQPTNQQTNKPSILTTSIPTHQTNKKTKTWKFLLLDS